MKLLEDLFKGPGNGAWELARFLSAWAVLSFSFAFLWSLLRLGNVPDWAALGTGYGAVLLGAGSYIGIKDFAAAKANATIVATKASVEDAGTEKPS